MLRHRTAATTDCPLQHLQDVSVLTAAGVVKALLSASLNHSAQAQPDALFELDRLPRRRSIPVPLNSRSRLGFTNHPRRDRSFFICAGGIRLIHGLSLTLPAVSHKKVHVQIVSAQVRSGRFHCLRKGATPREPAERHNPIAVLVFASWLSGALC
jgi:hypothetical protein